MLKNKSLLLASMMLTACAAPPAPIPLPDADSAGARLMHDKCGKCHGPPQPATHVAAAWPGVVDRMLAHRMRKAYAPLSPDEQATLLDYLRKHARGATL